MKTVISAAGAPAAIGPYSHAIVAGDLVFTSGQIPLVPETGKLAGDTIEVQAEQVFKNLEAVLTAAGVTFADVVKTTVFITDLANFAAVNAIYATRFPETELWVLSPRVKAWPCTRLIVNSWKNMPMSRNAGSIFLGVMMPHKKVFIPAA